MKKVVNIGRAETIIIMKELRIGDKVARIPVIQGGMGVGVSRSRLAGVVAKAQANGGLVGVNVMVVFKDYDTEKFSRVC